MSLRIVHQAYVSWHPLNSSVLCDGDTNVRFGLKGGGSAVKACATYLSFVRSNQPVICPSTFYTTFSQMCRYDTENM